VRQATRFDASTFRREFMREVESAGGLDLRPAGVRHLLASTLPLQPAVRDPDG
jgi:hypothetical protein